MPRPTSNPAVYAYGRVTTVSRTPDRPMMQITVASERRDLDLTLVTRNVEWLTPGMLVSVRIRAKRQKSVDY